MVILIWLVATGCNVWLWPANHPAWPCSLCLWLANQPQPHACTAFMQLAAVQLWPAGEKAVLSLLYIYLVMRGCYSAIHYNGVKSR